MKKVLLVSLSVLSLLTLTGCDLFKKKEDKKEENKKENAQTSTVLPKTGDEDEVIIKNPGAVIGTEIYDIKLNNKTSKLKIEYYNYPKSKLDEDDVYYVTYKVYLNDLLVDGITDYIMFDQEEEYKKLASYDNNKNFTYIKDTLKPTIIKGKDKEYLLIHLNGGGFLNSENIYLINDKSKLLGGLYIDKNMGVKLTGKNASKYMNKESETVMDYYYIENSKITYLTLTDAMYIKDEDGKHVDYERESYDFDEYVITINNDKLINTKTNNKYKGTDLEGGSSDFTEFFEGINKNS